MDDNSFFGGKSQPQQAVYFIENGNDFRVNPIYNIEDTPNTPQRFVILKTTANGKFLIGDMIHYNLGGYDIITDAENAIFVDTVNKTAFVRNYGKALREIAPENPEERQYILLIIPNNMEEYDDMIPWVSMIGRTAMYDYIKLNVEDIDVSQSVILTDNVAFKDALTVSQFVKYLHSADIVNDDFDISEFDNVED